MIEGYIRKGVYRTGESWGVCGGTVRRVGVKRNQPPCRRR